MSSHDDGHSSANEFQNLKARFTWPLPERQGQAESQLPGKALKDEVSDFKVKLADVTKPVYGALTAHQRLAQGWGLQALYEFVDEWWDILVDWAQLDIPRTALRLDQSRRRSCLGYFRPGHNEFGIRGEIAICVPPVAKDGRIDLDALDLGDLVGTTFHEQMHLLQSLYGKPSGHNHHNLEYRKQARQFGLVVDYRGHQTYDQGGPFLELLQRHGVPLPRSVAAPGQGQAGKAAKAGKSTLKKWSCGCTNVWVGVAALQAVCLVCEKPFVRA